MYIYTYYRLRSGGWVDTGRYTCIYIYIYIYMYRYICIYICIIHTCILILTHAYMKYIYIHIFIYLFIHNVYVTVRYSSVWCLLRSSAHTDKLTHEYTHILVCPIHSSYRVVHRRLWKHPFQPVPFSLGTYEVSHDFLDNSCLELRHSQLLHCPRTPKVFTHTHIFKVLAERKSRMSRTLLHS